MKRIELFEFEDFLWLPNNIRKGVTNLIIVFHKLMGSSEVITSLIAHIYQKQKFTKITDLGSGSGGPMIDVIKKLNDKKDIQPVKLVLSDLNPDPTLVAKINAQQISNVTYLKQSIDATKLDETGPGLKTMIASFHHLSPTKAKNVLMSAQESKASILIYEVAKNNIPLLIWMLFLPISLFILFLMSWVMTLFIRPLTFNQLLFTYLIPVIPIIYAWDGQASLMRTYTFEDVKSLLSESDDYHWEIDNAKNAKGRNTGYYILGLPIK
ncbi:MAG: hypothetical protein WAT79_00625 [Saprospiraceae bacterium]